MGKTDIWEGNDSKDIPMFPGFWQQTTIKTSSNDWTFLPQYISKFKLFGIITFVWN